MNVKLPPSLDDDICSAVTGEGAFSASVASLTADAASRTISLSEHLKTLTVLLVEDDDAVRDLLGRYLKRHVGKLVTAGDGLAGLESFNMLHPDIVITDILMPGLDGVRMARAIRAIDQDVPIILTTAFEQTSVMLDAIELGIDKFLIKPISTDLLKHALFSCVEKLRKAEQLRLANDELRAELERRRYDEEQTLVFMAALDRMQRDLKSQQFALDQHSIVAITDPAGNITYVNDKFCEISEYSRDELIGRNHRILKSGHHPHEFFKQMWRTIARGKVWQGEVKNRNKSGGIYWVQTTIVPFLDEKAKPYQYIAIRTDITQRKLDEEELVKTRDLALEASRLKSEFLATMSHEIRTPMNGVMGMMDMLLDTPLEQYQREYAHTIMESANALLGIINDILDFSKIEAGRMTLHEEDFMLADVVESVADILAPRARQNDIALMTLLDVSLPAMLHGDVGRVRQVLLNLVGNSIKFTEKGEVTVDVSPVQVQESSLTLKFTVTDTGIGMAPEVTRRLFQPFTQADGSTTRQYGGTGLGLSISKRLVELMGGEIGIESEKDKGSTFWFILPFKPAQNAIRTMTAPRGDELVGIRVLVVDDSAANRSVLVHYLSAWGAQCSEAADAEEALRMLRRASADDTAYDIALLDLAMPRMDGFELARIIQCDSSIAATRLVMLTSSDEIGHSGKALASGFSAYFNKPVRRSELFEGLCQVMRGDKVIHGPFTTAVPGGRVVAQPIQGNLTLEPGYKSILLVEDNPVNQNVAMRQLERLGYVVHLASDGAQALEVVKRESFALVLLDCQMPVMDGFEASRAIRDWETQNGKPRLPIIALTANAVEGDRERCLDSGMDDYLSKPVRIEQLQQKLLNWQAKPAHRRLDAASGGLAPGNAASTLDTRVLDRLRGEVGDYMGEIIDAYLDYTPALIENMLRAREAGDFDEVRMFAHSLKSSSLQLGLYRLGEMARAMELRIRSGDPRIEAREIESLFEEFHHAQSELRGAPQPAHLPKMRLHEQRALVLVVDDDLPMRLILRRAMESEGYRVEEASNGEQALGFCASERPDIVLMDCLMPVMNGFEACERLRAMPENLRPQVLMITGLNDEVSVQRAMDAGAADFITKPLLLPVLSQRVGNLLEVRRAQEHIKHLAYHDTLTGLPNRMLFNDRLHLAITNAKRSGHRLALLFLDLDHFKNVNDSLGHAIGDLLLKGVAERICAILREGDTLSRMGGDEFTLLLPQLPAGDEGLHGVQVIAEKIIEHLRAPFVLEGHELFIGTSIGISVFPDDSDDAAELLKYADSAMYHAKSGGRSAYALYSDAMNTRISERLRLESGLRHALRRNELIVYYQPQMNIGSQRLQGMEALLRWNHPELGLVSPAKFIPLAEDTGLIVEIGAWVLETACRECRRLHDLGYDQMSVAVNMSARQFTTGKLVEQVRQALEKSGLPPQSLDLEITESITMHEEKGVLETLRQLKEIGVVISMDDFGTGYSSLSYLKRFPIDILKIDQSFVRDITTDPNDAAIVETIIAMAGILQLKVIAEGVETQEQLHFLRQRGCQVAQGYLISRPIPAEELDALFVK